MNTQIIYPNSILSSSSYHKIQIDISAGWFNKNLKWINSNLTVYDYDIKLELPKTLGDIIQNKYIIQWLKTLPYNDVNFNIDLVVQNGKNKIIVYNTIKQIELINSVL